MPLMASAALDADQAAMSACTSGFRLSTCDDHLHFVEEAIGEQRADRAVDQAAGQRLQFAGRPSRLKKLPGILPAA
jgi:hypothetical protein